jgi:hypothetical protein
MGRCRGALPGAGQSCRSQRRTLGAANCRFGKDVAGELAARPPGRMIRPPTVWFTLIGIEVMSPRDLHPTSEGRSVRAATLVRWTLETAGGQAQGAASGRALRSIQRHRGVTLRQGNPEGRQPGADRPFVGENRPAPLGHRTSHQRMSASRLRTGTGVELQSTWRRPSAFQRPEIASLA